MPQRGLGGKASFGEESTAGTRVSRTISTPAMEIDLQYKARWDPVEELVGSGSTRNPTDLILASKDAAGSLRLIGRYAGGCLGMLLKHAMGAVSTSGSGPYAHEFTLSGALPAGLTVGVERGSGGLGDEVLGGCKINRLQLTLETGKAMEVAVDLIGMNAAARTGDTPPSLTALASRFKIEHTHAGTFSFDGNNYTAKRVVITIDNKLARVDELGTADSSEPSTTGMQEVTIEATLIARSDALQVAHLAGTPGDMAWTLSNSPRSLAVTLQNAMITSYTDPVRGVGLIEQTVKFQGVGDDSDHGLKIVLTNADSSAVAS